MSNALGKQGADTVRALRLTVDPDTGVPTSAAIPEPVRRPQPGPTFGVGDPAVIRHTEAALLRATIAERDARIADLEHQLRQATREREEAVAAVEKRERIRETRTRGGRLPSMWEAFDDQP